MRRLSVLVVGTAATVALFVGLRSTTRDPAPRPAARPSSPATTVTATPTEPPHYRAGRVVGRAVRTDYGVVQVSVIARRGRLVEVTAVRLPDRDPMDVRLSRPAARRLAAAVLEAQSADVDVVSGATFTSVGYLTSLQSALDQLS